MSSILHMETDIVRGLVRSHTTDLDNMRQQVLHLLSIIDGVDWQSASRNEFEIACQGFNARFQTALDDYHVLLQRLNREVDEWEQAAATLGDGVFSSSPSIGLPPRGAPLGSSLRDTYWNLFEADNNFVNIMTGFMDDRGDFKETLKILGMSESYKFFKDGIPYRGELDDLLRKFYNPFHLKGLGKDIDGFLLAGIGIGSLIDITQNTYGNTWKAIGVNTVDGLINVGLTNIPHVRAALLISGGIQLAGNLALGLERVQNDLIAADDVSRQMLLDQTQIKADSLEKMDLGNITKSFSESICDGFLFTDAGRDDLLKTAKSTVNVLDGTGELIGNTIVSSNLRSVALLDRAVQNTPFLSEEIKAKSSSISHEVLSGVRDYMKEVVNVFEWK